MARFCSLRLFFPVSLGSTIITRFVATMDTLTAAWCRLAAALLQTALPDYCARSSDHSVSNHPWVDRGWMPPLGGVSRLVHRFAFGAIGYSPGFAMTSQARPIHRPHEFTLSSDQGGSLLRTGRSISIALHDMLPCRSYGPVSAPVSQSAGERTFTTLNAHLLRRTISRLRR